MNAGFYREFHYLEELGNPHLALVTIYHAEGKTFK